MKENTAQVVAQVPVDVATFLLNEKRTDVLSIETRFKVNVLLVPNRHLETPNYTVERLRHDDLNQSEPLPLSFNLVEQPEEVDPVKQMKEEAKEPRQEAVVKGITPAQPAPMPVAARRAAAPAPYAAAPATGHAAGSWFDRMMGWFRGKPATGAAAAAPAPASREPARDRPPREQRDGRGRGGNERRDGQQRRDERRGDGRHEGRDRRDGEKRGGEQRRDGSQPRQQPAQRTGQPRDERRGEGKRDDARAGEPRNKDARRDGPRQEREPRDGPRPERERARRPAPEREPRKARRARSRAASSERQPQGGERSERQPQGGERREKPPADRVPEQVSALVEGAPLSPEVATSSVVKAGAGAVVADAAAVVVASVGKARKRRVRIATSRRMTTSAPTLRMTTIAPTRARDDARADATTHDDAHFGTLLDVLRKDSAQVTTRLGPRRASPGRSARRPRLRTPSSLRRWFTFRRPLRRRTCRRPRRRFTCSRAHRRPTCRRPHRRCLTRYPRTRGSSSSRRVTSRARNLRRTLTRRVRVASVRRSRWSPRSRSRSSRRGRTRRPRRECASARPTRAPLGGRRKALDERVARGLDEIEHRLEHVGAAVVGIRDVAPLRDAARGRGTIRRAPWNPRGAGWRVRPGSSGPSRGSSRSARSRRARSAARGASTGRSRASPRARSRASPAGCRRAIRPCRPSRWSGAMRCRRAALRRGTRPRPSASGRCCPGRRTGRRDGARSDA